MQARQIARKSPVKSEHASFLGVPSGLLYSGCLSLRCLVSRTVRVLWLIGLEAAASLPKTRQRLHRKPQTCCYCRDISKLGFIKLAAVQPLLTNLRFEIQCSKDWSANVGPSLLREKPWSD